MNRMTSEKSHVSLEQNQCPVCCRVFETGSILMDKRLRPVLDRETLTGHSLCDECADRRSADYVALIEVTPAGRPVEGTTACEEEVTRTGRVAHIRRSVIPLVFDHVIGDDQFRAFIDTDAYEKLIGMYERSQSTVQ